MKSLKEKIYALVLAVMAIFLIYSAIADLTAPEEELVTESDFESYEQE